MICYYPSCSDPKVLQPLIAQARLPAPPRNAHPQQPGFKPSQFSYCLRDLRDLKKADHLAVIVSCNSISSFDLVNSTLTSNTAESSGLPYFRPILTRCAAF